MPLILGLLLAILGFILLVLGGFNLPGRAKISQLAGRSAGVLFLLFFPLVFAAKFLVGHFALDLDSDQMTIVYWVLMALCAGVGSIILLRALWKAAPIRKPKARTPAASVGRPSGAKGQAAPKPTVSKNDDAFVPAPPRPGAPRQQAVDDANPFDFS